MTLLNLELIMRQLLTRWLGFRLDLLSAFVVLGAALFTVLGRDTLTAGIVGLSLAYALQTTSQLNWMVRTTCDLEAKAVSVERIKEYSELDEEVTLSGLWRDPLC